MNGDTEYLQNLIGEFENTVPLMKDEIVYYKKDNEMLKHELLNLEQENKLLALKLEECLSRLNSTNLSVFKYQENDLIENLKSQLKFSIKEKESISVLWKESLRRIDYLEGELKLFTAGNKDTARTEVEKVRRVYEKKIKILEATLETTQKKLEKVVTSSNESIELKTKELHKLAEEQNETNEIIKKLQLEITALQEKHSEIESAKIKLEKEMEYKNKLVADLKVETYNAKLKVAEACHVIEAALIEKDSALQRETAAQNEIVKLMKILSEVVEETESKIRDEVKVVKDQYISKLHKFEMELKRSRDELDMKNLDIEKRDEEYKQLELEIDRVKRSSSQFEELSASEKFMLTSKIEQAYQKLILYEKKQIQLSTECEELKISLEQQAKDHEVVLSNKEIEKKKLENKLKNLQRELDINNSKLIQVALHVEDLNGKLKIMDVQFQQQYKLKTVESEKLLTKKISEIEIVNKQINSELRHQLQCQMNMCQKWKNEVRRVTTKLEKRIKDLKDEISKLKSKKKELECELRLSEEKCTEYKLHLERLCVEFNDMTSALVP